MMWLRGNGSRGCGDSVVSGPSQVRCYPVRAVPLAAFIPSRDPGRGRGAWGGSASGETVRRGQSRGPPRRRIAAGEKDLGPRPPPPARGNWSYPPPGRGGGQFAGRLGQATGLPRAPPLVNPGPEPGGGG